ncbi:MAG: cobalt ECF transporter T component CbiQ [Bacillota bacterium]
MDNLKENTNTIVKNIPDWLINNKEDITGNRRLLNLGFIRHTLLSISQVIQNDLQSERFSAVTGLMQSIDTRVRLLTMLYFMIFTALVKSTLSLLFLFFIALMLARLSGLVISSFLKRVWLFVPLVLLFFSIPAATNLFIDGKPVFYLFRGLTLNIFTIRLPESIYFSYEGLNAVVKMVMRTGVSLSFGYVLFMTTRWSGITKSLSILGVPGFVISILNMTYKYIFILIRVSIDLFEARFLRTIGRVDNRENRRFASGAMAYLFLKSHYISEEVYSSMICRGYSGKHDSLESFKLSVREVLWCINILVLSVILIMGEITLG